MEHQSSEFNSLILLVAMSDTDTGGCCDDSGKCDDNSARLVDTCEETTTCMNNTEQGLYYPDSADICFDQPINTYSYDGDYCYEDAYQPVYSSLSTNNPQETNHCVLFIVIILAFTVGLILCEYWNRICWNSSS